MLLTFNPGHLCWTKARHTARTNDNSPPSVAESDRSQPSPPEAPTLPTVLLSDADTNVGILMIITTVLKAPKLKALTPQNCPF